MGMRKISISKKLNYILEEIQDSFCIIDASKTIQQSIEICVLHYEVCNNTSEYANLINEIKKSVTQDYGKKEIVKSFRISDDLLKKAKNIYQSKDPKDKKGITFAISCCLMETHAHILYAIKKLPPYNPKPLEKTECLFYRPGRKTGPLLKKIINLIEEIEKRYDCDTLVEPFCGTVNTALHLESYEKKINMKEIYLNDKEQDIINLLSAIQEKIDILLIILLRLPVNKQIFDTFKAELRNSIDNTEDIVRATKFYYFSLLSGNGNGSSYNPKATNEELIHNLISLIKISKILQGAVITQEDIFTYLEKKLNQKCSLEKTIFYVDPPYLGTEHYYTAFDMKNKHFHEELRNLIILLREKGAKIILSYRATVTDTNKYTSSLSVQKQLNNLYKGRGFFLQFQKVRNNQIEILIISVQVSNSIPFNKSITDLIWEHLHVKV